MRTPGSSRRPVHDEVRTRLGSVVRSSGAEADGDRGLDGDHRFDGEDDLDNLVADTPTWLVDEEDEPSRPSWQLERFRDARIAPGRRGALALGAVGIAVVVLACVFVFRERQQANPAPPLTSVSAQPSEAPPTETQSTASQPEELVVSVVGLVHVNGLVRLPPGSRVADAIAAAGGPREGADLFSLNMAQRVADGDQILVGLADANGGPPVLASGTVSAAGGQSPAQTSSGLVDLNTATEAELDALPGVGPVTAAAIIAWRNTNGPFTAVDQLAEVDGIGPSKLANLRDLVTL